MDKTLLSRRVALAGGAAAALAASGAAAAPRALTVASLFGDDKPETVIWQRIRDRLAVTAPGRFQFRIVGNAALGGEKDVAEGLRLGSVQGTLTTLSVLSGWAPEAQLLDLPFLMKDRAHVRRVVEGPVGDALKATLAEQGFVVLGFINYGARHLLAKGPATRPRDVSGQRIRVIQSPLHTALWSGYGAYPTPLPIPECYNALKSGVVDMMDLTKSAYVGFRLHEVVPVVIETGHIWAVGVVHVSRAFWQTLTQPDQAALAEAAAEGARAFDALMVADETASMAKAMAEGARAIPAEDREAWEAGARPVWTQFAAKVGGAARIDAVRQA